MGEGLAARTAAVTERQRGDRFDVGVPKAVDHQRDGRRHAVNAAQRLLH